MKILVITPGNLPVPPSMGGSVETVIDQTFHRIAKTKNVTIVNGTRSKEKWIKSKRNYKVIHVHYGNSSNYLNHIANRFSKKVYDLIQIENRPKYVLRIRREFPHTPIVLSLHSLTFMNKLNNKEANTILSQVNGVVVVSNFLKRTLIHRFPNHARLFKTIHLGVDSKQFSTKTNKEKEILRKNWKVTNKKGYNILFVGRIIPKKGLHILVKAVSYLKNKHPNLRVIVVGSAWPGKKEETRYIREVRWAAARLKIPIVLTGYIPPGKIHTMYHLGDIFAFPTQFEEGFGLVNIEAMASGIPIIASKRGGIKEVIKDNKTGVLVADYTNPRAFAKNINHLIENRNLRKKVAINARKHVTKEFSWNRTATQLSNYYTNFQK